MNSLHWETFDFDQWMELAHADPAAFEELLRREIEWAISQAPESTQPRLRALQWRIDMERAKADTPMAACVSICKMMCNRVYGENGLMTAMAALKNAVEAPQDNAQPPHSAEILAFEHQQAS